MGDVGNCYFATLGDDGTYSEPVKVNGIKDISTPEIPEDNTKQLNYLAPHICSSEFNFTWDLAYFFWYINKQRQKGCLTCRNCKEMYRYPGFVTYEPCICIEGLECDTYFGKIENCPKYVDRPYGEPQLRNPDLDKYHYVIE